MSDSTLLVIEPTLPASHDLLPLLIVLHGNNSTNELEKSYWASAADAGWLVACIQSSQVMNPNRYMWTNLDIAISEIKTYFAQIMESYLIDTERIVVGGFSRGAFAGWSVWGKIYLRLDLLELRPLCLILS